MRVLLVSRLAISSTIIIDSSSLSVLVGQAKQQRIRLRIRRAVHRGMLRLRRAPTSRQ
jgi:hypothetical protein